MTAALPSRRLWQNYGLGALGQAGLQQAQEPAAGIPAAVLILRTQAPRITRAHYLLLLSLSSGSNKSGGSGEREKGGKPNARTQLSNSQPDPTPDHTSLHRQNRTISRDRTSSLSRKANQRPRSHRTRNTQRLAPRRRVNAPPRQRTPRDRRSRRRRSRCPAPDDYRRRDGTPQDRPRTTR